jgi:hypothetical protein
MFEDLVRFDAASLVERLAEEVVPFAETVVRGGVVLAIR